MRTCLCLCSMSSPILRFCSSTLDPFSKTSFFREVFSCRSETEHFNSYLSSRPLFECLMRQITPERFFVRFARSWLFPVIRKIDQKNRTLASVSHPPGKERSYFAEFDPHIWDKVCFKSHSECTRNGMVISVCALESNATHYCYPMVYSYFSARFFVRLL